MTARYLSVRPLRIIAALFTITCLVCVSGSFGSSLTENIFRDASGQSSVLAGNEWELVSYYNGISLVPVATGSQVTLRFIDDKQVAGSGGINGYSGPYSLDSRGISFGTLISTLMAGPEPRMSQESTYFRLLGTATQYRTQGTSFELMDANGLVILKFKPVERPAEKDAATTLPGTEWQLSSYMQNDAVVSGTDISTITLKFDNSGNIGGSSGVNSYFATYAISGRTITTGPIGSTKMAGPVDLMDLENTYLGLMGSVTGVSVTGNSLYLSDAKGDVVLTFVVRNNESQSQNHLFIPVEKISSALLKTGWNSGESGPLATWIIPKGYTGQDTAVISRFIPASSGHIIIPGQGTTTRPAAMPRLSDNITPPRTWPGGPLF